MFLGGSDVVITGKCAVHSAYINTFICFEFKKDPSDCVKHRTQAVAQLLAIDELGVYDVISVLTDLNDYWELFWLECGLDALGHLCNQQLDRSSALGFLKFHIGQVYEWLEAGKFTYRDNAGSGGGSSKKRTRYQFETFIFIFIIVTKTNCRHIGQHRYTICDKILKAV